MAVSLIPQSDINVLKNATEVSTVADSAEDLQDERKVACAINNAANCGLHQVLITSPLRPTTVSTLESKGYTVTQVSDKQLVNPGTQFVISW